MNKPSLAQALLSPQSIALIGASADETKTGGRPLRYLLRHGYAGKIYPVNPRVKKIGELDCYPDLASIPGPVDHAFIMLSGDAAVAAVLACSAAKIPCATILAGGFAEAGERGAALQEKLLQVSRDGNVRLLGPNSIGMINPVSGATLSANAMLELPELVTGRTAVISQSGSMIGAFLSHGAARHVGFSKLISVGNEADLSVGEIADLLLDDDDTDVILLFLETIRDHKRLAEFARRAHEVGKPVVAYKLGRSNVGQELARSHTGAIAGSDDAIAAFLKQNGFARVDTFNGLIESPRLFAGRAPGSGKRVAVVSTTGGGGAMVVDNLGLRGVDVVEVPTDVSDALAAHNIAAAGARMIDLTMAGAKPEIVADVISRLMASDETDAVIMVVGSSAQFHPELAVDPLMRWRDAAKPFAVYLAPAAEDSLARLANAGIAVFRTPEGCADAMHAVLSWTRPGDVPDLSEPVIMDHAALQPGQGLNEGAALALFSDLGISTARSALASSDDEAVALAQDMPGPVALKIASADIQHKSDMGGVRLGLEGDEQVKSAWSEIMANAAQHAPDAVIDGVLVQEMATGLGQVLLGFKRDPLVGPIVVLGVGGLLTEIYGDTALRMAPVNLDAARSMIEEVRGLAPLRGYRGSTPGDLDALAHAIVNFSRLALREDIYEAEINPVLVRENGRGVIAVDGVVLGTASAA
jgi:acetate---CoA ligase (ADP-forming)